MRIYSIHNLQGSVHVVPDNVLDGPERPLYEIKANLFKALAHPARIRVLEIVSMSDDPVPVSAILGDTDIEPTVLSQHLAVLKRHHVVQGKRVGNAVYYQLAHPKVAELLRIARVFLTDTLAARRDQLDVVQSLPPIGTR
nr:metalloregulator ArsR/SmtB family transcription factor [Mycolicibacterium fluoranthenivorans]